ncbi:chemotaxis protein CheW [Curvivirga aplysinae]|uniref:chemotaxis protein CheW n=1 Tax=Curvivirga aplysinae TaxID=2529852 RepID=UPI002E272EAC
MSDIALADSRELAMIDEEQLVTMTVDGQAFGIPILMVQDIVEPDQITPVPLAPGAIAGVLNLRGRIVTVIDMRELLGSRSVDDNEKQMSVTVEYKGDLYTFLVDSIGDVRSLPRKSFDKPPATLDENLRRLCSGVFRLEDDLLVVLDVERMLEEETIMKTPRRTRKRRKVVVEEKVANQNDGDDEAEDASVKKPKGTPKASSVKKEAPKSAKKSTLKPKSDAKPKPAPKSTVAKSKPAPSAPVSSGPAASGVNADHEQKAMLAVEKFAARVDSDPILSDLFKDLNDAKLLDLLVNLFNAAYGNPGAPLLESAYLAFIKQPGLGDDHFMSAGTNMHATLMDLQTEPEIVDRIMSVIDETRIKVLDVS